MIKGVQKEQKEFVNVLYTGFTKVTVKAINPSRTELNRLLGKEDSEDDKPIEYLGEDKEGNQRLRLVFWLHDEKLDKYFPYSFNLTDKERTNKDGNKNQFINSVCMTSWADHEDNLQNWFTSFLDKDKSILAAKTFRKALSGEEELATLLRGWLGRLSWNDTDTAVEINTKKLFEEDYSELQALIDGDFDSPFVILTGVRTDEADTSKQYQQVYGKAFLPAGFMQYIEKKFKFPTDYSKKVWGKFKEDVQGEYGFNSFYELEPLKAYDREQDPAVGGSRKDEAPASTPVNSKY